MNRITTFFAAGLAFATSAALAAGPHAGDHAHPAAHAHHDAAPSVIGQPGVAAQVTRTITVDMDDRMRFTPADIRVRQGETVRLRVRNVGAVPHELVLGTEQDLRAHNEAMQKQPGMAHAEPNMVTLAAGKTGEIVWRFTQAGQVDFGCLQPGHYGAGMKGVVQVAKAAGQ